MWKNPLNNLEVPMNSPLESLIATGTKLWLDSIDPDLVRLNRAWGPRGNFESDHRFRPDQDRPLRPATRRADPRRCGRRANRLANDRRAGARGPGSVLAGLGIDRRQRRLRQLRARSVAGGSAGRSAACRARCKLHRTGQAMVGRPQESHDQSAGHARRPRRAGRALRRRHHARTSR